MNASQRAFCINTGSQIICEFFKIIESERDGWNGNLSNKPIPDSMEKTIDEKTGIFHRA